MELAKKLCFLLLFFSILLLGVVHSVSADNLTVLGYYGMNTTSIIDSSVYGNNGSNFGATQVSDTPSAVFDYALNYSGDYSTIPDKPQNRISDPLTNYTTSLWVKVFQYTSTTGQGGAFILFKGDASYSEYNFQIRNNNDNFYYYTVDNSASTYDIASDDFNVPLDNWVLLTRVQYSNGTAVLYENTTAVGSVTLPNMPVYNTSATVIIGKGSGTNYVKATVGQICYYDGAMNSSQLSALYNGGIGTYCDNSTVLNGSGGGPVSTVNITGVNVSLNSSSVYQNLSIYLTVSPIPSGATGVITYDISWGDGLSNASGSSGHGYYAVGSYDINVTATDPQGNTVINGTTINVTSIPNGTLLFYEPPEFNPNFVATEAFQSGCVNGMVGRISNDTAYLWYNTCDTYANTFGYMESKTMYNLTNNTQYSGAFPNATVGTSISYLSYSGSDILIARDANDNALYAYNVTLNATDPQFLCQVLPSSDANHNNIFRQLPNGSIQAEVEDTIAGAGNYNIMAYQSESLCGGWFQLGRPFSDGLVGSSFFSVDNGTWTSVYAKNVGSTPYYKWAQGNSMMNQTIMGRVVLNNPVASFDSILTVNPVMLVVPSSAQQYWDKQFYFVFTKNVTYASSNIAVDGGNRSFYEVFNVTPAISSSVNISQVHYSVNATTINQYGWINLSVFPIPLNASGVTYNISWSDGTPNNYSNSTHQYSTIGNFLISINASDGQGNSVTNSTLIMVQAVPPAFDVVNITPYPTALSSSTLQGSYNFSMLNGSNTTVYYSWALDGVLEGGCVNSEFVANTTLHSHNKPGSVCPSLSAGQKWAFAVSFDGSAWNYSGNTTINDTTFPMYSGSATSSQTAGSASNFSINFADYSLGYYIFAFDNGTGTLTNGTSVSMAGASSYAASIIKNINSTSGTLIRWQWWVNDSSGNVNITPIYNFTSTNNSGIPVINASFMGTVKELDSFKMNYTVSYNASLYGSNGVIVSFPNFTIVGTNTSSYSASGLAYLVYNYTLRPNMTGSNNSAQSLLFTFNYTTLASGANTTISNITNTHIIWGFYPISISNYSANVITRQLEYPILKAFKVNSLASTVKAGFNQSFAGSASKNLSTVSNSGTSYNYTGMVAARTIAGSGTNNTVNFTPFVTFQYGNVNYTRILVNVSQQVYTVKAVLSLNSTPYNVSSNYYAPMLKVVPSNWILAVNPDYLVEERTSAMAPYRFVSSGTLFLVANNTNNTQYNLSFSSNLSITSSPNTGLNRVLIYVYPKFAVINFSDYSNMLYQYEYGNGTYAYRGALYGDLTYQRNYWFPTCSVLTNTTKTIIPVGFGNSNAGTPTNGIIDQLTIQDQNGNPISDAIVKIERLVSVATGGSAGNYNTVEVEKTNSEGVALARLVQYSGTYKFVIQQNCVTTYISAPTIIFSTSSTITVSNSSTSALNLNSSSIQGLQYNIANNNNQSWGLTYNQNQNVAGKSCIYYSEYAYPNYVQKNSSCSTSTGGTLSLIMDNTTSNRLQYYWDGNFIAQADFSAATQNTNLTGATGILFLIIITAFIIGLTLFFGNIYVFFFTEPFVIVAMQLFGFVYISSAVSYSFAFLLLIIGIMSMVRRVP